MNDRHAIELARSSLRRAIASIPDDEYRFSRYAQGLLKASLQSFLELRDASKKRPSIAGKGKSSSPRHPKPDTAIVPGPETFDVTREHYDAVLRNLPLEDQALLHRCMDGQTANQIAYTTKQSVRAINKQLSQILAGLANAFSRSE